MYEKHLRRTNTKIEGMTGPLSRTKGVSMNILHITAHMGGGPGKAISGLASYCNRFEDQEHRILVLEAPKDMRYVDKCREAGVPVAVKNRENWEEQIAWSDVLVVSWWGHPLMLQALCELAAIPCRILLWIHANGCVYPYLPYELTAFADGVLLTTMYTAENPFWTEEQRENLRKKSRLVIGMGDFRPEEVRHKISYACSETFTIGYAGTLSYAKLHTDFFRYCKTVIERIPNVRFLLVGEYSSELEKEAQSLTFADRIEFTGHVSDIYTYFEQMDAFGYLLSDKNYATTDNILLEAMAAGLPILAYANKPESYVLENNRNGFLVRSMAEYAERVAQLVSSKELRQRIGMQARKDAILRYRLEDFAETFRQAAAEALQREKTQKDFCSIFGLDAWEQFLSLAGPDQPKFEKCCSSDAWSREEAQEFLWSCDSVYRAETKCSIPQFHFYAPQNRQLAYLEQLIREKQQLR